MIVYLEMACPYFPGLISAGVRVANPAPDGFGILSEHIGAITGRQ